jgi:peptidoglycan/xylan/chitin deacetylase (PgdA/CDA1 family)
MPKFKKIFKQMTMFILACFVLLFKRLGKRNAIVRVLIFHGVETTELGQFNRLIERLSKDWNFISPDEFFAFADGELDIKFPSLLVTFDDGFKSSAIAAKEVLDKKGIKAMFFLISDFVG